MTLGRHIKQALAVCSVGGLKQGLVIELANGSNAMVLEVTGSLCNSRTIIPLRYALPNTYLHDLLWLAILRAAAYKLSCQHRQQQQSIGRSHAACLCWLLFVMSCPVSSQYHIWDFE